MCFTREPNETEKKTITELCPSPIKPEIDDFSGKMLLAGSDQFLHVHIEAEYGDPTKIGDKNSEEDDDAYDEEEFSESGFSFADAELVSLFNADIETWLHKIHAICPIVFACRAEDSEAGGTELSEWHKESVARTQEVLEYLQQNNKSFENDEEIDLLKSSLSTICGFAGLSETEEIKKIFNF